MPQDPMEWERRSFRRLKKFWMKIKSSKWFNKFRQSDLNPYHKGLPKIEAESFSEAKKIARQKAIEKAKIAQEDNIAICRKKCEAAKEAYRNRINDFIYNGTRYNVEDSCLVQEEFARDGVVLRGLGDVSDRIPRDENGKLDLLAEDPIAIAVVPIEGPALVGHVCMQYQDVVVNRLLPSIHTDPLYPKYQERSQYYFIYPSQLGIDPKKLKREMEKHNIKYARKRYDLLTNNCARNVANIFKKVGVNDIDFYGWDKAGLVFTNPGNNPWGKGIKAWCLKHGVHVNVKEMEAFHNKYNFTDVKKRRETMDKINNRYKQHKKYKRNPLTLLRQIAKEKQ